MVKIFMLVISLFSLSYIIVMWFYRLRSIAMCGGYDIIIYDHPTNNMIINKFRMFGLCEDWSCTEDSIKKSLDLINDRLKLKTQYYFINHVGTKLFQYTFNRTLVFEYMNNIFLSFKMDHPNVNPFKILIPLAHDCLDYIMNIPDVDNLPKYIWESRWITNQGELNFIKRYNWPSKKDIIVLPASRLMNCAKVKPTIDNNITYRYSFVGTINHYDPNYSHGIRKKLYIKYHNVSDIMISEPIDKRSDNDYLLPMMKSRYCLFIRGGCVWSERLSDIIKLSCVPVILSDNYTLPFSSIYDWSKFSIIIPESRIDEIDNILSQLSDEWGSHKYNLINGISKICYDTSSLTTNIWSFIITELD